MPEYGYIPMKSGERRFRMRLVSRPRVAFRREIFPEGTVYRAWVSWIFLKLMVKA